MMACHPVFVGGADRARGQGGARARPRGLCWPRCTLGTGSFPLALKEVGLRNHVHVGGWGERSLARRVPLMKSGREHPYGHFLLCFSCSDSPPVLGWGARRAGQEAREDPRLCSSPVHLLAGPAAGTECYLCLQIAFELFLCQPVRDGRELWSWRAEKSGRWRKERRGGIAGPGPRWGSATAVP